MEKWFPPGTHRLLLRELRPENAHNQTVDFGVRMNQNYWNRGFTTESASAILDTAFRSLGMYRVRETCGIRNTASYRVMEKHAMRREALLRKGPRQKAEWCDPYRNGALAKEWENKPSKDSAEGWRKSDGSTNGNRFDARET